MSNEEKELEIIEFESARNEAFDQYTKARPQLFITREKELFFEAGFRMAWELKHKGLTNE